MSKNEYPFEISERLVNRGLQVRASYDWQNVGILLGQWVVWYLLLSAIQYSNDLLLTAVLVIVFCFFMQGVFSLMHEFFHSNAHKNPLVNYCIGVGGSLLFGTSATFHRVNHWGHHLRNRTVSEQGEFIHEGESKAGKITLYYIAVLGGLWLLSLLIPLAVLFVPYRAIQWLSSGKRFNTYSAAFLQFTQSDWNQMRLEALLLILFWTAIFEIGPWSANTLVISYAAFAFLWSSLQWVYHLGTPLHAIEGAYNLRLPTPVRWLFLNFNCNLTHHRHFEMPWQELYEATNREETQPLWYRWLLIFHWPIPFPKDLSILEKRYF